MKLKVVVTALLCASAALYFTHKPEGAVRVATYNIKFFKADDRHERIDALRKLIEKVDADIWGLQEIDDRAALERVFDPADWQLIIDDDSGDNLDLALAVKRPLEVIDNLDADDENFLFSDADDHYFPKRRDVLHVRVKIPGTHQPVSFLVTHAKSRYGGRASTEERRIGASRLLLEKLVSEFKDKPFILLGDMNDNPDDPSVNILESGIPSATFEEENNPGEFLINLTEPLMERHLVTSSLERMGIDEKTGVVINLDRESRARNRNGRNTDTHTGNILFDQILIPRQLQGSYIKNSITIFNGIENLGCSDHLPVYADFNFGKANNGSGNVRIAAALPNPDGWDPGNEKLAIENTGNQTAILDGWILEDRAKHRLPLKGTVGPNETVWITLPRDQLPLNNSGDQVSLFDSEGRLVDLISYHRTRSGEKIEFTETGE